VLEIDVDVGRLIALPAHEALEEEVDAHRIDGRDAEVIAHRRVRRRPAPLAQDGRHATARKEDEIMNGQEIRRIVEFLNEFEFVVDLPADALGHMPAVRLGRALRDELAQMPHGRGAGRHAVLRILVADLVEAEAARAVGDGVGALDRLGMRGKEAVHLLRSLEMALGIGVQAKARLRECAAVTDASEHILEHAPLGTVMMHIVDGDERHTR